MLVVLTSHWVSMLGFGLVTTAGFSWLFVLPIQLRGHINNPYMGVSLNALSQDLAHQHWRWTCGWQRSQGLRAM
jgi:hypothetical protein